MRKRNIELDDSKGETFWFVGTVIVEMAVQLNFATVVTPNIPLIFTIFLWYISNGIYISKILTHSAISTKSL